MNEFENLKLKNQLCFALYAATNAITRAYRSRLSEVGLTYPQYLVMMVLWEADGISVKNIATQLHTDSPTIMPLLKRLELADFISRQRSLNDERVINIFLTETGRVIQARVADMQKSVACQTGLPETQFVELRSTLHGLIDSINQSPSDLEMLHNLDKLKSIT